MFRFRKQKKQEQIDLQEIRNFHNTLAALGRAAANAAEEHPAQRPEDQSQPQNIKPVPNNIVYIDFTADSPDQSPSDPLPPAS